MAPQGNNMVLASDVCSLNTLMDRLTTARQNLEFTMLSASHLPAYNLSESSRSEAKRAAKTVWNNLSEQKKELIAKEIKAGRWND
jgi:hypothetical protein